MSWFCKNVPLLGPRRLSPWRNAALSAWRTVGEASVHAVIDIEAGPILNFIESARERTGTHPTLVHCTGKATGMMLRRFPDINCLLRFGRLYQRRDVDIFFTVALDRRGEDLSGVVINGVDSLPVEAIAEQLTSAGLKLRQQGDTGFRGIKATGVFGRILSRLMMHVGGFILYTLNIWSPLLGMPKNAFGSAAVSDISRFGSEFAFPPLLPIARIPLVIGMGPVITKPVYNGGEFKPVPHLRLCVVFDHRVIDGVYAGRMFRFFREIFSKPDEYLTGSYEVSNGHGIPGDDRSKHSF